MTLALAADPTPDRANPGARHDRLLEQTILGALMTAATNAELRDQVIETGLTGRHFYLPAHEEIWETIQALADRGVPPDPVAVSAELTERKSLARVGGRPYLHELITVVTSPWTAPRCARDVVADAALRALDTAGTAVRQLAGSSTRADLEETLDAAQAAVAAVAESRTDTAGLDDISDAVDSTMEILQSGSGAGLPTGISDLDRLLLGGLRPGTLTTIGARPGVGKTIILFQIALHVALAGGRVLFVPLEMTREDLLLRAAAALASVDYSRLLLSPQQPLTESEWRAVAKAMERIRESGLVIPDRSHATAASLRADVRRMQRRGGCDLVAVDYLQLLTPADARLPREQQIAAMMRALKLLAKGTPSTRTRVLIASQLSREGEKTGRPPILTDLRESGSIEQDSDTVVLLHRVLDPDQAGTGPDALGPDQMGLLVAKNRRGQTGGFRATFEGRYQRIQAKWSPSAHAAP